MNRLCIVLCFWIVAAAASAQTVLKPMETLNQGRSWAAVGRLSFDDGRGFCTATLIAEDLVLTAGHCLYDELTRQPHDITSFEFQAGWRNGRAEAYRKVREARADPDYRFDADADLDRIQHDIALVRLDRPIRHPLIQPLSISGLPQVGETVGVVSYARGRMNAPSLQEACVVTAQQSGVLIMTCDVDFGASGSPVFVQRADGVAIVSVVSAMADMGGKKVSLGTSILGSITAISARLAPTDDLNNAGTRRRDTGAKFARP